MICCKATVWIFLVSAVALWSPCLSYYNYQTKIPNGQQVPHPCKPNYIWHGVGHRNPLGGGDRNQFGLDFISHGHKWTPELCHLDSDNDGLTNGQELGDPNCVWTEGHIPASTDNITHPGVCDPWGSPLCASHNTWVSCDVGEFQCDAIHQTDVRNITLRFPRTKVPAAATTYECFVFDIPADETYHLIAYTPYIDNPNVMHHIVIYSCKDDAKLLDAPQECNMAPLGCDATIGVWSVGMTGDCLHPEAGFRIGKEAATRIAFQFHWTNKHLVDNWYDSSGVTLYFTPKLRRFDAGILYNGQMDLVIPPGQPSVVAMGSCSSACTQRFMNGSINIIAGLNHMHYLGIQGKVELIRNGHVIMNVTNDNPYSYDSPHVWKYPDPVVMVPGDELKITCEFSSLAKNVTTYLGPGSYDEMCFGLITYYPAHNFQGTCIQWKGADLCDFQDNGCQYTDLFNKSNPLMQKLTSTVLGACRYGSCQAECPAAIAEAKKLSTCLQSPIWEYLKDIIMNTASYVDGTLAKIIIAMDSCDHQSGQSVTTTPAMITTPATPTGRESGFQINHGSPEESGQSRAGQKLDVAGTFLQLAKELGSRPLLQNIIFNVNGN